jgi:hypothetical protein
MSRMAGGTFSPKIEARDGGTRDKRDQTRVNAGQTRSKRGPSVAAKVAACGGASLGPQNQT